MTVRIIFDCDARRCTESFVHLVDDVVVVEAATALVKLREAGWTFAPSPRGQHVRGTTLKVKCPVHKGSRR
jgi:hypothetical protein